jgi:hypothetical protein
MDENRIWELLMASAQDIPVPEGLRPEQTENLLRRMAERKKASAGRIRRLIRGSVLSAAAVMLCVGAVMLARNGTDSSSMASGQTGSPALASAGGEESSAEAGEIPMETSGTYAGTAESSIAEGRIGNGSFYPATGGYEEIEEYLSGAVSGADAGTAEAGEQEADEPELSFSPEEIREGETVKAVYEDGNGLQVIVGTAAETRILAYDLTDPEHPVFTGEAVQEGQYGASALESGRILLVTGLELTLPEQTETDDQQAGTEKIPGWVPEVNGLPVPAENSFLSGKKGSWCWVASSFARENPGDPAGSGMLLGEKAEISLDGNRILLSGEDTGFALEDGGLQQ